MRPFYLDLNRFEEAWKMRPREWVMGKAQFTVIFCERSTGAMANTSPCAIHVNDGVCSWHGDETATIKHI